jgi:hypothetical protein
MPPAARADAQAVPYEISIASASGHLHHVKADRRVHFSRMANPTQAARIWQGLATGTVDK